MRPFSERVTSSNMADTRIIRQQRYLTNTLRLPLKYPLPHLTKHSPSSTLSACGTLPLPSSFGYSTSTLPAFTFRLQYSPYRERRLAHLGRKIRRICKQKRNFNGPHRRRARRGIVLLGTVLTSRSSRGCCATCCWNSDEAEVGLDLGRWSRISSIVLSGTNLDCGRMRALNERS